jgi:hypothetical protein
LVLIDRVRLAVHGDQNETPLFGAIETRCGLLLGVLDFAGARVVASILVAKLVRQPQIRLPVPGSRRTIRLRTNSSDIATYNQIFIRREYDFSYLPHAAEFLSGTRTTEAGARKITVVDCGANVGCSVIWFANEYPGAEIVAVEPDLANFELLNQNVADLDNVRTIRAA